MFIAIVSKCIQKLSLETATYATGSFILAKHQHASLKECP